MSSSGNAVPSGEYPAFYTLLTHQETNISPHHTLVFDTVRTDTHKEYSNYTGAYTVPVAGVYVISWSVRSSGGHSFELVCNGQVLDSGFNDGNSQKTTGKTYLGHFKKKGGHFKVKDVIFVRTHNSYVGSGYILSNTHGYSTFLGYK
ncbi:hypothetical protein FSP39_017165 [Pinctada imbricata]|uniref:C1q domain-containing protein n=1 Tax=Pinctada imbricata TaxID=66713 RepID=A0AA88YNL3_PINIB|nr:hypothetical protein FSP39_017165 [Pinctada imbricata]